MSLSKTAVIFGMGPGIGWAAAREFAAIGYQLALVARNEARLARFVAQFEALGVTTKGFVADGADGPSIDVAARDILKNVWSAPILQTAFVHDRRTFCVNVFGLRLEAVLPALMESARPLPHKALSPYRLLF